MKFIFIWLILIRHVYSVHCPVYCKCHMQDEYRYVGCTNRGLISIELDVPTSVEWLQLSDNSIHALPNYAFLNLKLIFIQRLELNRNAINSIGRLAFHKMDQLASLDLSNNHLYSLDPSTFEHLGNLVELDLSSNPLRRLPEPFLVSSSIQILNIKACNLGYISRDSLLKLPNLRILGLANNQLNKLLPSTIQYLTYLDEIDLRGNHIRCDSDTDDLLKDFSEKGSNIYGVDCPIISRKITKNDTSRDMVPNKNTFKINSKDKFQRMVMTTPLITTTVKYKPYYREDPNNQEDKEEEPVKWLKIPADTNEATNRYKQTFLLIIVFFSGLSLGALLAFTSMAFYSLYWSCQKRRRELNRMDVEMNTLQQNLIHGTVSTSQNVRSNNASAPPLNY